MGKRCGSSFNSEQHSCACQQDRGCGYTKRHERSYRRCRHRAFVDRASGSGTFGCCGGSVCRCYGGFRRQRPSARRPPPLSECAKATKPHAGFFTSLARALAGPEVSSCCGGFGVGAWTPSVSGLDQTRQTLIMKTTKRTASTMSAILKPRGRLFQRKARAAATAIGLRHSDQPNSIRGRIALWEVNEHDRRLVGGRSAGTNPRLGETAKRPRVRLSRSPPARACRRARIGGVVTMLPVEDVGVSTACRRERLSPTCGLKSPGRFIHAP
jgi:hypothetical protein